MCGCRSWLLTHFSVPASKKGTWPLLLRPSKRTSFSPYRAAWLILDCARRTSTFLSCAFREQEDDQAAHLMLGLPPMCGRFTQTASPEVIAEQFDVAVPPLFAPRYNIAPSQAVAAIRIAPDTATRQLVLLRWGLIPSWAKDPKIGHQCINAKAETVAEKPSFRAAFKTRRCLVIATGFYE